MKPERSRKKQPRQYLACLLLSAFCAFMTGGFAMTIIFENENNRFPAIVCTILFLLITVVFIVLSVGYHKDDIRKAYNEANRNYLRFRN